MIANPKVYKLKSGQYQVSFVNPATRKRTRRKFPSHSEVKAFIEDLNNRLLIAGSYSSAESVEIWMKRYLELHPKAFIARLGKPLTESFLKSFGHIPVMSVTENAIKSWLEAFQQERKLSVKTMPNIRCALNQFFQFIVDCKSLTENPVIPIKKLQGLPPKERTVLTKAELIELLERLETISPTLIYPVTFLLAHIGARLGEILNLKWKDVHFELGAIQLLRTKNGEDRLIHVSDEVLNLLQALPKTSDNVVLSQYGTSWTYTVYVKQFNKIRKKTGFHKYWCNHALRHSFATNYLKAGGNMLQLQKILGHKTLEMTVDLYGQIQAQDVQDISPFKF